MDSFKLCDIFSLYHYLTGSITESITIVFSQAAISVIISNLLICVCSFDLSCPILEKENFIEILYIVLSCLVLLNSVYWCGFFFKTLFESLSDKKKSVNRC